MSSQVQTQLHHGTTTADPLVADFTGDALQLAIAEQYVLSGLYLNPDFDLAALVALNPANGLAFLKCVTCFNNCGDQIGDPVCTPLELEATPPMAAIDSATPNDAGLVDFDMTGSTVDPLCAPITGYTIHIFNGATLLSSVTSATPLVTVDYEAIATANGLTVNDLTAVGEVADSCLTDSTNNPTVPPALFTAPTISATVTDNGDGTVTPSANITFDPNCATGVTVVFEYYDSDDCTGVLIASTAGTITGSTATTTPFDKAANMPYTGCDISVKAVITDGCGQVAEDCNVFGAVELTVCHTLGTITDATTGAAMATLTALENGAALGAGSTIAITHNGETETFDGVTGALTSGGGSSWIPHFVGTAFNYTLAVRDWLGATAQSGDVITAATVTTAAGCTKTVDASDLATVETARNPLMYPFIADFSGAPATAAGTYQPPLVNAIAGSVTEPVFTWNASAPFQIFTTFINLRMNDGDTANVVSNPAILNPAIEALVAAQCVGVVENFDNQLTAHMYAQRELQVINFTVTDATGAVTSLADLDLNVVGGVVTDLGGGVFQLTYNAGIANNSGEIYITSNRDDLVSVNFEIVDYDVDRPTRFAILSDATADCVEYEYRTGDC